jgi:signal transduction histidine kinase
MNDLKLNLTIGGKSAINWTFTLYALPILILIVPLTENRILTWWTFWRWTFISFLSLLPILVILFFVDTTIFKDRERKPVPTYYVFTLGFFLGFVRGIFLTGFAFFFNMLDLEEITVFKILLIKSFGDGLIGMLLIPFASILISSLEIYKNDRNALIADRMFHQSQKNESVAVIKSLRSSMTRKVDENLLEVIKNSQEYFDSKGKSLEENWELMALKLRKAALDTIRPFSHKLHRAGEEKEYRVKAFELLRFIANNIRMEISWVILGYLAFSFKNLLSISPFQVGLFNLVSRIIIIYLGLKVIAILRSKDLVRSFWSYLAINALFILIFLNLTNTLNTFFDYSVGSRFSSEVDALLLFTLIFTVGFASAFFHGQHAETAFLERQLSREQLHALLMKREEDRLSRELAKYLHGTIQSRLMASAMAIERAGRKGDKKALEKEISQAYESLKVPSASYFAAPAETFKSEVAQAISKWKDLLKVKTKIDKKIGNIDSAKAQEIGNAINEGLSNAFRHGNASQVIIDIQKINSGIKIEIQDNGDGPKNGKGGLGTEWFNAIAGKSWKLSAISDNKGSKLELLIPN